MRMMSEELSPEVAQLIDRYRLAVPNTLKQRAAWLVWRFESASQAGEKPRKMPYYVTGIRRHGVQGSPEDIAQLATFEQALDALRSGRWTALGLAPIPGCGLNSWDFDNVLAGERQIPTELKTLLHDSGTYCEISPSGTGIRMVSLGTLPSIKRIHPDGYNVELFGESGYVTITGNVLCGEDVTTLPASVEATLKAWLQSDLTERPHSRAAQLEQVKGTDPVYQTLKRDNWIKREFHDGRIAIRCPFEDQHTSGGGIGDTTYFLPNTSGYSRGHFHCLHAHCANRADSEYLETIGYANPIPGLGTHDSPIVPADRFMADWTPTEYLVKGILQRGQLVALTGHSNAGKTAIALKLAFCVALGLPFGRHKTKQERVVYFAGENADDVRCRVIALCQDLRIKPETIAPWLYILPMAFPLAQHAQAVKEALQAIGHIGLIIIDTRAAYASAGDENANMEALADARVIRDLMTTHGRPTALVLNHPPHRAPQEDLKPRGGSSYWGELDSNLTAWNDGSGNITLHWNKIRGAHWEPVTLNLRPYTLLGYVQPDGDPIQSVVVDVKTDDEAEALEAATRSDEDSLLIAIADHPEGSLRQWSDAAGWKGAKNRVSRLLKQLHADGLVRPYRRSWNLTKAGETAADKARGGAILGRNIRPNICQK